MNKPVRQGTQKCCPAQTPFCQSKEHEPDQTYFFLGQSKDAYLSLHQSEDPNPLNIDLRIGFRMKNRATSSSMLITSSIKKNFEVSKH